MKQITEFPFSEDLLKSDRYFWNCRTPEQLAAYHKKLLRRPDGDSDYQALLSIAQNNRKLFSLISSIQHFDGWTSVAKGCALASIVLTMRPKVAAELGVWAGKGLLPVAFAMKEIGFGKVVGIDPYSAQESVKGQEKVHADWWQSVDHAGIKQKFLGHVKHFDLESIVSLIQKPSNDVEPFPCDLISLDGNHGEQALTDAERFGRSVSLGGIVFNDDLMWGNGYVLRSLDALEDLGFRELFRVKAEGECWNVMQKVK